jgi:hypothetical protein
MNPEMYTAQSGDLTPGGTNPHGVWSVKFLRLKKLLDAGAAPQEVMQALYAWLAENKVAASEIDAVLDLKPDKALEALWGLVMRSKKPQRLPPQIQGVLQRTLHYIAQSHVSRREHSAKRQLQRARGMRTRFGLSAESVVNELLA